MKTYCVNRRKNTEYQNSKFETKNDRLIMQSKCVEFGIKKSRFAKEQEAKDLLSNLGIKTPSSKISKSFVLTCIKMNEIVNKFLLVGDKCMPEMHLK